MAPFDLPNKLFRSVASRTIALAPASGSTTASISEGYECYSFLSDMFSLLSIWQSVGLQLRGATRETRRTLGGTVKPIQ
jgi:hypothetical protein